MDYKFLPEDQKVYNQDGSVFANAVVVDEHGTEWLAFATVEWSDDKSKVSVDLELVTDDEGNEIVNPR